MKDNSLRIRKKYYMFGLILTALLFLPGTLATAQSVNEEIHAVADVMPAFPGGQKALMQYVNKQMVYPEDALSKGIQGKVMVKFVVTKEGKVTDVSISKGLYPSIDAAVLEIVKTLPKFEPATIGGKPVNCWFAFPVTFKMEGL
ncbi:MAG TPA: energy transducer TonB [Bacteroidales bacterium]|nr:energy transducer TonB [Bacteroidales bacterium]